jgi:hypothetical protein
VHSRSPRKLKMLIFSRILFCLYMQTIRVAVMQGTQVATQYLNDQLKDDLDRDELVARGKVSRHDADADGVEWAEVREDVSLRVRSTCVGWRRTPCAWIVPASDRL